MTAGSPPSAERPKASAGKSTGAAAVSSCRPRPGAAPRRAREKAERRPRTSSRTRAATGRHPRRAARESRPRTQPRRKPETPEGEEEDGEDEKDVREREGGRREARRGAARAARRRPRSGRPRRLAPPTSTRSRRGISPDRRSRREDEPPRDEEEARVAPVQRAAGQERREAERGGAEDDGESPRGTRERARSLRRLHAAQGFRASTRSDIPNDGSVFSSALEQRHDPLEGAELSLRQDAPLQKARVEPPAEDAGPVQVADRFHREARARDERREGALLVAAVVAEILVERAVERRAARARGGRGVLPGWRTRRKSGERAGVVLDVLEHVQADDRVDALASRGRRDPPAVSGNRNEATRTFPCFSNRVRSSRT